MNIAPKRANWDLKRDMDKKMARLERRTQEAIHALIRTFYRALVPDHIYISSNCNSNALN
jgi:hypothetical protein